MFKISALVRALLSVGILRMTEDPTGGAGGGGTPDLSGGGQGGQGGQGGGLPGNGGGGDPYAAAPKSWSPEHHPHWGTLSADVRKIVHDRESHYDRGINGYKQGHETWSRLSSVFKDVTASNPNVDVAELYEGLAQNHMAMVKATPEQRKTMLKEIAQYYGVTFEEAKAAAADAGAGGQPQFDDKKIKEMIKEAVTPLYQERQTAHLETVRKTVDAFFSDPQNEFISEVGAGVMQYAKAGITDLKMAYQMACLNDPKVAPRYIAKLSSGSSEGGQEGDAGNPAKPGDRNLHSSGQGAPSGKTKTMDQTMGSIAEKAYPGYKHKHQA